MSNKHISKFKQEYTFEERKAEYFYGVQPYQHHTGPVGNASTAQTGFINVYSFALKPEEHQPSGTCNFSRIDNAQFVNSDGGTIVANALIFAVNYNVLRIMSGMGGLAYSN